MNMTTTKKKIMLAAILTSGLTLAISQAAMAEPNQPAQPGPQGKSNVQPCQYQMNTEMKKIHDKFLDDTVAIRKELAEKNAVMRALMNAGTPDTVKASQVAGELFELREKLRAKAKEAGLPMHMLMMGHSGFDGMACDDMHGIRDKQHRMKM
jgi:zinc resistance-associated protein